jgi:hypothetical protein
MIRRWRAMILVVFVVLMVVVGFRTGVLNTCENSGAMGGCHGGGNHVAPVQFGPERSPLLPATDAGVPFPTSPIPTTPLPKDTGRGPGDPTFGRG